MIARNRNGKPHGRPRRRDDRSAAARAIDRVTALVDQAIYQAFPKWGARRLAIRRLYGLAEARAEILNQHLGGAETDRTNAHRWLVSRLSPDAGLEADLATVRERCEELYRKDPIGHAAIEGRIANEIGTGILPQSQVSAAIFGPERAKAIAERLEQTARRWSLAGVDRTGREGLVQVEKLAQRMFAVCGEAFIVFADRGAADKPIPLVLDVVHPVRVETPPRLLGAANVRMGIEYDAGGRVVRYHVRRTHPGDTTRTNFEYDAIPAFDANGQPRMAHVLDPMFPGQSRGIPWMAAALQRIKDASDILDYEIIAKQVESCFAAFVSGGEASPLDAAAATATDTDDDGRRTEELRPGMIEYLAEGQSIDFANPVRPGATFFPLIEYALRTIAAALNYPYELLANNFFRTTFSAGRLAMLAGRIGFRMRRRVLIDKLLQPTWRRLVYEAVLVGELDGLVTAAEYRAAPWELEAVRWQEPGWSYIDPEKEIRAHVLGVESDLGTIAAAVGEQGGDLDAHLDQRLREKEALVEQAVRLRALRRDLEQRYGLEPEASSSAASGNQDPPQSSEGDEGEDEDEDRDESAELLEGRV